MYGILLAIQYFRASNILTASIGPEDVKVKQIKLNLNVWQQKFLVGME